MRLLPLPAVLLGCGLLSAEVTQPPTGPPPIAQIEQIIVGGVPKLEPAAGDVRVVHAQQLVPARPALPLFEDDEILTGPDVTVTILCLEEVAEEDKTVFVGAASQIRIRSQRSIFVILGRILANVRGRFDVATARATLGSRGTEFEVRVTEDGATHLVVLEGIVDVQRTEEAPAAGNRAGLKTGPSMLLSRGMPVLGQVGFSRERLPQPATVGRLEEVTIQKGDPATRVRATTEDRVRGALGWSTEAAVAGQPANAAKRTIPHFETAADRARAFRQAKFEATWRRDPGAYETLGKVFSDWDEGTKAVEAFGREVTVNPARQKSASFQASAGEALRMKGRLQEAEAQLVKARSVDPENARALNGLGNVYFAQAAAAQDTGANDAATSLLEKCLKLYAESRRARLDTPGTPQGVAWANDGEARLALGDIARQQNRLDEAATRYGEGRQAFARAAGADPRYVFGAVGEADAARRIGSVARLRGATDEAQRAYREAESEYRKVLEAQPNLSAAHLGLGDLFIETGRREAAIESYTRAVMLRPDQPVPHLRLGLALADKDPQTAARYAKTYLELEQQELKRGQRVALASKIASAGSAAALVPVPNLVKMSESQAREALKNAGLTVGTITPRAGPPADGTVIEQDPTASVSVKRGSPVNLIVAARGDGPIGPAGLRVVPKVEDRNREEARRKIQEAGFTVGRIESRESSKPAGTVLDQKPDADRKAPAGSPVDLVVAVPRMRTVEVPDVVGDSRERAVQKIRDKGLIAEPITERASCEEAGKVIAQEPAEDARVQSGTPVALVVASPGPRAVRVPQFVGRQLADVYRALREQPLKIRNVDKRPTNQERPDTILSQAPRAGTVMAPDCPVDVVVAIAIPRVRVPNFIGMTEVRAKRELQSFVGVAASGLRLGRVEYQTGRGTPGTVVGQSPAPGIYVEVNTPVHLVVIAQRQAPQDDYVIVPNVTNRMRREAEATLSSYGLRVQVQTKYMRQGYKEGQVISQSPQPGERVPRGTVIQIVVATTLG